MSGIKVGDRLRVEYEAEVTRVWEVPPNSKNGWDVGVVRADGGLDFVRSGDCTVLPPAPKVGDILDPDVDPEPPIGTVLIDAYGDALKRYPLGWLYASITGTPRAWAEIPSAQVRIAYLRKASS